MILSEIKKFRKIYLITERDFVVKFFKKLAGDSVNISVELLLPDICFSSSILVILDSCILESSSAACFSNIEDRKYPVLCLIGSELSEDIRNYVDKEFKYILPFPTVEKSFTKCFIGVIKKMQKCNVFETENSYYDSHCNFNGTKNCISENGSGKYGVEKSLFGYFVGESSSISAVRRKIKKLATTDVPILLLGETGTGKSTGASIIHKLSKRNRKDMKSLNISTIDEAVACSTFFGTTLGAFTDALDKKGFFTLADKGTLFLDEIGLASNAVQSMLLTVVETGMFRKIGSETFEKSDVRLIFATNADLGEMVKDGTFRKDFFCRICGNAIMFPTIRSRKEDIPFIVAEHIKDKNIVFSDDSMNKLMEYDWPGNIRELHQCLDRAMLYTYGDTIQADDIDFGLFCM